MKTLKTLLFLVVSALTLPTWAKQIPVMIYSVAKGVTVEVDEATSYTYLGACYEDGVPIAQGEKVAMIFARHKDASTKAMSATSLFAVGRNCISLTEEGRSVIDSYEVHMNTVNEQGTIGWKNNLGDSFYSGAVYCWQVTGVSSALTTVVYFLRFDSRVYDLESSSIVVGGPIQKWDAEIIATILPETANTPGVGPSMGGDKEVLLDLEHPTASIVSISNPVPDIAALSQVKVEEALYAIEDLSDYLKTDIQTLANNDQGGLTLSLGMTIDSNDANYNTTVNDAVDEMVVYTLETTDSLENPNWKLMDEVLKNLSDEDKNNLAMQSEKCYTCLRVKDSTQIKIPRLPNEIKRFYRLIAE